MGGGGVDGNPPPPQEGIAELHLGVDKCSVPVELGSLVLRWF